MTLHKTGGKLPAHSKATNCAQAGAQWLTAPASCDPDPTPAWVQQPCCMYSVLHRMMAHALLSCTPAHFPAQHAPGHAQLSTQAHRAADQLPKQHNMRGKTGENLSGGGVLTLQQGRARRSRRNDCAFMRGGAAGCGDAWQQMETRRPAVAAWALGVAESAQPQANHSHPSCSSRTAKALSHALAGSKTQRVPCHVYFGRASSASGSGRMNSSSSAAAAACAR